MDEISIPYTIGNEIKQLKIKFLSNGTGQVMLDKYYHGQAVFSQNKWNVYLNDKSELKKAENIEMLIQILNGQKE